MPRRNHYLYVLCVVAVTSFAQPPSTSGEYQGKYSCGALLTGTVTGAEAFEVSVTLVLNGNTASIVRESQQMKEAISGLITSEGRLVLEGIGQRKTEGAIPWKTKFEGNFEGDSFAATGEVVSIDGTKKYRECSLFLQRLSHGQDSVGLPKGDAIDSNETQPIPRHLELARELVATVKPENNKYVLDGPSGVRWKGDFFTSENTVKSHCVGFVSAVLDRAKSPTVKEIESKTYWRNQLRVDNYYESTTKGYGLEKILHLGDAKPGDLIVFRCKNLCPSTLTNDNQGHIAIVDMKPVQRAPTPPIIDGTLQWIVPVIDSSDTPHDQNDTRYSPPGAPKLTGAGRGTYRVYTDLMGNPVGYTNGYSVRFHSVTDRIIVIGRPFPKQY